jgi:hypothetical protein
MLRPQPRSFTGIPPNLDREKLEGARRLAELAEPHLVEAVDIILEVMRDKKSRQRLAAVAMLAEFASRGEVGASGGERPRVTVRLVTKEQLAVEEQKQRALEQSRRLAESGVIDSTGFVR